jgi:hypothetical protein
MHGLTATWYAFLYIVTNTIMSTLYIHCGNTSIYIVETLFMYASTQFDTLLLHNSMHSWSGFYAMCWSGFYAMLASKIPGLHLEIRALMEHIFYIVCLATSQNSHTTFIHCRYHNYEHKMVCMHTCFPK